MSKLGYAFLHDLLDLSGPAPHYPALSRPVVRIIKSADHLAVPETVAGRLGLRTGDPLAHVLFALKHEGTNLGLLMEIMVRIPMAAVAAAMVAAPGSALVRKACYLWEAANATTIEGAPAARGAVVDLFDPSRYVTMDGDRNARWRVHFNGLGSLRYCATVERTDAINAALQSGLFERVRRYAEEVRPQVRDRALEWAYLDETRSSFAIEREVPSEGKQRAFVALLHAAHMKRALTEDYLVELQVATVSNPLDKAVAFRGQQNFLQGPLRGAAGVTYVPPPPDLARELMDELMAFTDRATGRLDPLVVGAVASFGFVFLHPFMDGNGRLSRFLVHYALCQSGQLENGLILPVSIAMKEHEDEYLATLTAFSASARERWSVGWIGDDDYDLRYLGSPGYELYRYWDATRAVAFCYRMAEQALERNLRENTEFILRHDYVRQEVERVLDVRNSALASLATHALLQGGTVSKRRRDQFEGIVPPAAFDLIEATARYALAHVPAGTVSGD